MSIDLSNITKLLKLNGFDTSDLNQLDKGKIIDDANIFNDEGIDQNLLTKDGFVSALHAENTKNAYTEEELGQLYDALNALDGDDSNEISADELEILSSLKNDKSVIEEADIQAFLDAAADVEDDEQVTANLEEVTEATEPEVEGELDTSGECECGCEPTCPCNDEDYTATQSILKDDDRILTDDDGNKYVNVEPWSSDPSSNNALSRIIVNSYDLDAMGIEYGSDNYKELEKLVMDANPDIYGSEDGGWRNEVGGEGRANAVLYTGDKVILPEFSCDCLTGKTEDAAPAPATTKARIPPRIPFNTLLFLYFC